MSEDCVDRVVQALALRCGPCRTKTLPIHGYLDPSALNAIADERRSYYGSDLASIQALETSSPELHRQLHLELTLRESDVVWGVRHELARTVDDMLARRSRSLFLDAAAAVAIAPRVAAIMARELGKDNAWEEAQVAAFTSIATHYLPSSYA